MRLICDTIDVGSWTAMQIASGKKKVPLPEPTPRPWEQNDKSSKQQRTIEYLIRRHAEENANNG